MRGELCCAMCPVLKYHLPFLNTKVKVRVYRRRATRVQRLGDSSPDAEPDIWSESPGWRIVHVFSARGNKHLEEFGENMQILQRKAPSEL